MKKQNIFHSLIDYDKWFHLQVESGLCEADNLKILVPHEHMQATWIKKRSALTKQLKNKLPIN